MKFLTNQDLSNNQLMNAAIHNLAIPPQNPVEGQVYFNTTSKRLFTYNGSVWVGADAGDATLTGSEIVTAINGSASIIDLDNLPTEVGTAVTNAHTHNNKTVLDNTTASFTLADETKLDGIAENANNYSHPVGDGNLHVPATSTTNNGKVLTAGATAGSLSWQTPSVAWANISDKPVSSTAQIDSAVTNSHTHANKALLDTYTQTEVDLADAVSKKHAQNTDTGTTSNTFAIDSDGGSNGLILKAVGGELNLRNSVDGDYANLRVKDLVVTGTSTTINSVVVSIGDNEIELNSDVATNAQNSDGGLTIKRLDSDDTTRIDAKITYDEVVGKWKTTQGGTLATMVTAQVTNKISTVIGDGLSTSYVVPHNLNTRDLVISVRDNLSPYEIVYTDIEMTTLDSITLHFSVAPVSSKYTVTIIG